MTRPMIAYLIDPFTRRVSQVIHNGDYRQIYELIGNGCRTFDAVGLWHRGDAVFVDDEGLFRPNLRSFGLVGYPDPLFGRGVVLGSDAKGESTKPRIGLDALRQRVAWLSYVTGPAEQVEDEPLLRPAARDRDLRALRRGREGGRRRRAGGRGLEPGPARRRLWRRHRNRLHHRADAGGSGLDADGITSGEAAKGLPLGGRIER